MNRALLVWSACLLIHAPGMAMADSTSSPTAYWREAYAQPLPGLSDSELERFYRGRQLVRQSWVIPPSQDTAIAGLGPLYNRNACIACHTKNGRGYAPDGPEESLKTMLVRLSVPGVGSHGGPVPHSVYGDQLNEFGVPGVPGEGEVRVTYSVTTVTTPLGKLSLRQPHLDVVQPAYGALTPLTMRPSNIDAYPGVLTSARIAPALHGTGLLEAIPISTLQALARQKKPAGIKGRLNQVWDPESQRMVPGRFGWKANTASLRLQTAGALVGDMGITSQILPGGNCGRLQTACLQAQSSTVELQAQQLDDMVFYQQALAVPPQRNTEDAAVMRGARIFRRAHCAACHMPVLKTSTTAMMAPLANQTIRPYTDLLLHDMGPGLADHRPDFMASGSEWRTPPLWGIGLANTVEPRAGFLHDGRARTLLEAIYWHDGEARASRVYVEHLRKQELADLLTFMDSL
jgi:CxxC motif-containing protein (DUF1111 family)